MGVDYFDAYIREIGAATGRVKKEILSICYLEYASLCVIPKKNLEVTILVTRIFGGNIASGLKYNKSPVTAYRTRKRVGARTGGLSQNTVQSLRISTRRERRYKNNYECEIKAKLHRLLQNDYYRTCLNPNNR